MNVFAQTLIEHFLFDLLTLLVGEHPVGKLRVPAQAVTTQLDAVLTAEVSNLVGTLKVPHALFGMQFTGLHVILSSDAVELSLHQINLVGRTHITLVKSYTNHEVVLVSVLQFNTGVWICWSSKLCPCAHACHRQHKGESHFKCLFHCVDFRIKN